MEAEESEDKKKTREEIENLKARLGELGVRIVEREGAFVIIWHPQNPNFVLLVKHGYDTQKWSLPGGGIKQAEFSIDAAKREVEDETGLISQINPSPIAHLSLEIKYGFTLLFEGRSYGKIRTEGNGEEITACKYFHIDHLPNMYNAQRGMIGWALSWDGKTTQYGHPNKPPIEKYRTEQQ